MCMHICVQMILIAFCKQLMIDKLSETCITKSCTYLTHLYHPGIEHCIAEFIATLLYIYSEIKDVMVWMM